MIDQLTIRQVTKADQPALKTILDETGLFPAALLDPMIAPYFASEGAQSVADPALSGRPIWLTVVAEGAPIALSYCDSEAMTDRAWNLLAIGVRPSWQSQGVGEAMVAHVETLLRDRGARLLLVETSGLDEFDGARAFYRRCGFEQEARIRDFYADGEDKIVFVKPLAR